VGELAVAQQLSSAEARSLTDEVKRDAESLWQKLVALYQGGAHTALGYSAWGDYFEKEFGQSRSRGYQLLDAGKVLASVHHGGLEPPSERQARELAPLLDEPETLRETWAEVRELHPEPTAADVRKAVGRRMDVHYSSERDDWSTPQDLFDLLDQEFNFTLDVCATDKSAKCATWFTKEQDGLAQPWTGSCWMNPPYGDEIGRWVGKAWNASKGPAAVVCLVPARVDTTWWWNYCRHGDVRFLRGRLRFGGGETGAPFPSAVVVFPGKGHTTYWERGG
jgi:phage N-6-adenine-methyltransferase